MNFPLFHLCLGFPNFFVFQGPTEKEQIDVQGDIIYDIVEFITDTWPDVTLLILFSSLICSCFSPHWFDIQVILLV